MSIKVNDKHGQNEEEPQAVYRQIAGLQWPDPAKSWNSNH